MKETIEKIHSLRWENPHRIKRIRVSPAFYEYLISQLTNDILAYNTDPITYRFMGMEMLIDKSLGNEWFKIDYINEVTENE